MCMCVCVFACVCVCERDRSHGSSLCFEPCLCGSVLAMCIVV